MEKLLKNANSMKINQLCLTRTGREILQQVNTDLPDSGVVVLLGANGAGKSSLLEVMAGLLQPDHGEVQGMGSLSRYLLPEPAVFYPYLSVREQLQFVAWQMQREAVDLNAVVKRWGLNSMANRLTRQLSLGYRQRLSLAQLDVSDANVLLMDEPMNGMDPQVMDDFQQQVLRWKKDKLIVIATHIMQEIESLADWVVVMHQGHLIESRAHDPQLGFQALYQQAINQWQAASGVPGGAA